ncbi:MAG: Gfo/Idh/MocA family oxidoreductase [Aestuariivirga sp.]|uniref:Gfo/Idh/MocA family oxidoreductase n=1 Tax=Aestuariivirga sp. TaxID=2650926 RepID=UPI0038D08338
MSIGVGIIGAGIMGADHARIIAGQVAGAHLVAVCDADMGRAEAAARESGARRVIADPMALIADPEIGAVLIASPDATHADYAIACIKAAKPVLCEKPLAPTAAEGLRVIEAELTAGRRFVQLGFMRRFDPGYTETRALIDSRRFGAALAVHCVHRNLSAPPHFNEAAAIVNSCVHEVDISRFLLSAELVSVQVFRARRSSLAHFHDPLLAVFETSDGQLVDVELFLNAQYGYEVRGEVVCETGTIAFGPALSTEIRHAGVTATGIAADWRPRFAAAYRIQNQAWIDSIRSGKPAGASAWDGFIATTVTDAGVKSLGSGASERITREKKPSLY